MGSKVVICGAGFLGSNIAKALTIGTSGSNIFHRVQLSSRSPQRTYDELRPLLNPEQLLPPVAADVTKPDSLKNAFKDADLVVSLVGVMNGSVEDFNRIQWKGAENVAKAAKDAGARLVHFSAIGADPHSSIPYARTKALGEAAVLDVYPQATIIRPSLVFGPGDGFFLRFGKLSQVLPFLPVFGGGTSRFQPVFVGDIARAVEIIARDDEQVRNAVQGKVLEAGGPEVFTYRQLMDIVLQYTERERPVLSLPFALGATQGFVMEQLPVNLFTVTRAQVEQLKSDNIVNPSPPANHASFKDLVERNSESPLKSVHEILPTYLKDSSSVF
ncbi:NAD(P)-binding protein [Heliocybe sulcata]|uniref:NAD(P)-binding protein n=1 Tax=Heliocybe sulcata TaxID=5364 RepID=A0A5C3NKK6_9AGAM|nr:NAD(P)-binding protein [Heliocybe sulcata]